MPVPKSVAHATCSVQNLDPLIRTLRRLGVDVDAVLVSQGLTPAQLDDPDLRIPIARSIGVWRVAYDAAGDPALGLRVVEDLEIERFTLFAYLAASSETGRQAFERATRYARISVDNLDYELIVDGPHTICRTGVLGYERSRPESEFAVGMMVKLAPFIAGETEERAAWFRHAAPPYADEVEAVFGCPVSYGQRFDAIVGRSDRLDAPLPRADSALCALLEEHAAGLLARVPQPAGFTDRVRERISTLLPRGEASAEGVAAALGVSPRTLRRGADPLSAAPRRGALRAGPECAGAEGPLGERGRLPARLLRRLGLPQGVPALDGMQPGGVRARGAEPGAERLTRRRPTRRPGPTPPRRPRGAALRGGLPTASGGVPSPSPPRAPRRRSRARPRRRRSCAR